MQKTFKKMILGKTTILKNEMKVSHEKTSKIEKWKNRKLQNIKIYIFSLKPHVKNDIFEKKNYFNKTIFFNEKKND